ncbi:hypothetical protein [Roseiconus lacunae]|uniref:hypothetical protein n=1 Tax=Roseiconus lacunae TaxID=2605694 RepID=UPI001E4ED7AD|nr:hypothetical protein [Roseiconus lacunae]MCD0458130.1 hypothetical protein [Roseiconus lacunae]
MTDDSSPWVPDKPPPNKLSEDYLKEEIKSARNGISGFLMLGFAVGRTVQIFSRRPGTSGLWMLVAWLPGVGLQGFYLAGHAQKYGRTDATPFEWLIAFQALIWMYCLVVAVLQATFRTSPPMKDIGTGVLGRYLPISLQNQSDPLSDAVVGIVLIMGLHLIGSPVQAGTYQVIVGWIMICHCCVFYRDWSFRQRMRQTKARAGRWHEDVRGRHHL